MIISNPPSMPAPDESRHDVQSGGAGLLGIDGLETIVRELDTHLTPMGQAQIVTAAPGDDQSPTALLALAERHLNGNTRLQFDPLAMPFEMLPQLLPKTFPHQHPRVMHDAIGEKDLPPVSQPAAAAPC